eukprot:CAMPEP_0182546042 /NCGR_PEP_ID=MMETSP1323-20130603/35430_1 /TAXON_ID=236787 /ORGANISM="Florenciella parvula, Strain RCC1693" /LENGTH=95 /DNA_ID=CAMNT_0024757235 /DNA_START=419 /DNA_END=705 /DNA_ORIENTATION=-
MPMAGPQYKQRCFQPVEERWHATLRIDSLSHAEEPNWIFRVVSLRDYTRGDDVRWRGQQGGDCAADETKAGLSLEGVYVKVDVWRIDDEDLEAFE